MQFRILLLKITHLFSQLGHLQQHSSFASSKHWIDMLFSYIPQLHNAGSIPVVTSLSSLFISASLQSLEWDLPLACSTLPDFKASFFMKSWLVCFNALFSISACLSLCFKASTCTVHFLCDIKQLGVHIWQHWSVYAYLWLHLIQPYVAGFTSIFQFLTHARCEIAGRLPFTKFSATWTHVFWLQATNRAIFIFAVLCGEFVPYFDTSISPADNSTALHSSGGVHPTCSLSILISSLAACKSARSCCTWFDAGILFGLPSACTNSSSSKSCKGCDMSTEMTTLVAFSVTCKAFTLQFFLFPLKLMWTRYSLTLVNIFQSSSSFTLCTLQSAVSYLLLFQFSMSSQRFC